MKNAVIWDVAQYGSCKNRHFGGTYRLHHQGDKNRRTRKNISNNSQPKHAAKKYYVRKEALEWDIRLRVVEVVLINR
jgi:hypothetical protein